MINKLNNSPAFKGKILTEAVTFKQDDFKTNTLLTDHLSDKKPKQIEIDSKAIWSINKLPEKKYTKIVTIENGCTCYHFVPMKKASTAEILAAYNATSLSDIASVTL